MKQMGYPIVSINSDAEKAWGTDPDPGSAIQFYKFAAKGDHMRLGAINGFMSHLRRFAISRNDTKYITQNDMKQFVQTWNSAVIPKINCTRYQMMKNPDLEEAYIAYNLNFNDFIDQDRMDEIGNNEVVTLKPPDHDFEKDNPQQRDRLKGLYQIIGRDDNAMYQLKDLRTGKIIHSRYEQMGSHVTNASLLPQKDGHLDVDQLLGVDDSFVTEPDVPNLVYPLENNKGRKKTSPNITSQRKAREVEDLDSTYSNLPVEKTEKEKTIDNLHQVIRDQNGQLQILQQRIKALEAKEHTSEEYNINENLRSKRSEIARRLTDIFYGEHNSDEFERGFMTEDEILHPEKRAAKKDKLYSIIMDRMNREDWFAVPPKSIPQNKANYDKQMQAEIDAGNVYPQQLTHGHAVDDKTIEQLDRIAAKHPRAAKEQAEMWNIRNYVLPKKRLGK
jgi:hypothetical protein